MDFNNNEENNTYINNFVDFKNIGSTGVNLVSQYLEEIDRGSLLTRKEELELMKKIKSGDMEAKKLFIEKNLRLVVYVAKRYSSNKIPFLDLIQEGNMGLMVAVNHFDEEMGYKFSTYAYHWIKQYISRAIMKKERNISVPFHFLEKINLYKRVKINLEAKLNRFPTTLELANEMKMSIKQVTEIESFVYDTVSINTLIGDSKNTELEVFLSIGDTVEETYMQEDMQQDVRQLLVDCKLTEKEIQVLMLRYGFDDKKPLTLQEIAPILGVTRERVRQIEARAIVKIRRSKHINRFATYMYSPKESMETIEEYRRTYAEEDEKKRFKLLLKK